MLVRCDREDVCRQPEDICRRQSRNAQTAEVDALFKRALSVLSALTAIETLRGERMCANIGGFTETTFRECTDNDD